MGGIHLWRTRDRLRGLFDVFGPYFDPFVTDFDRFGAGFDRFFSGLDLCKLFGIDGLWKVRRGRTGDRLWWVWGLRGNIVDKSGERVPGSGSEERNE